MSIRNLPHQFKLTAGQPFQHFTNFVFTRRFNSSRYKIP